MDMNDRTMREPRAAAAPLSRESAAAARSRRDPDERAPSWREWAIPLSCGDLTLGEALAQLRTVNHTQHETPLIVKLIENPKFQIPGFELFNGAVDIHDHDCIHILLGRGLLPKDEAFVIGFTMGSSHRVTTLEENLFAWISRRLYPGPYRLDEDDVTVFRKAAHLGFVANCQSLNEVDYGALHDLPLDTIRSRLGIDKPLLRAWYRIEKAMFPCAPESQRLLVRCPARLRRARRVRAGTPRTAPDQNTIGSSR